MVEQSLTARALRELPARTIIEAIADTARAWADQRFVPRQECAAAIESRTGYSAPVVQFALDQLFTRITSDALTATIRSELGTLDALDGFVERAGRSYALAASIGDVCMIASRTTIGVALLPAIYALCAKCTVTVKDREDRLIAEFVRTLQEREAAFAQATRAEVFSWADESTMSLAAFDCVVAFGRDETLRSIRNACAPNALFIGFGSRASAGYISRTALDDEATLRRLLAGAARDVVLYETEGCMSLHLLFVEGAHDGELIGERFAEALGNAARSFPRGARDHRAAARFATARDAAAFRASFGSGRLVAADDFAILLDPPADEPPPFAPRCIPVIPVQTPHEALQYLRKHQIALEAFAISEAREDIEAMAVAAGAVRLSRFGALQQPPACGNHGGRGRIVDFIRWVDRER
ncbi:MAG: hypothetical protein JOZ97_04675 [Candidatus Eremiobacteraeota bacterium]|nr:hypothetical protein [Candidatus Eremiobacteraeota bacterium]